MVNFRWYNMSKITVSEIASLTSGSDTELTFATGASGSHATRLSIASGGNVGIGDTSPTQPLTVGTTAPVMLLDDQNSRTMEIRGPSGTHNATVLTTSNHDLLIGTNNSEQMRVKNDGEVQVASANDGGGKIFRVKNTSNTANSTARMILQTGGSSGGDVFITFDTHNSNETHMLGVDKTDQRFALERQDAGLFDGTNRAFDIDANGKFRVFATVNDYGKVIRNSHGSSPYGQYIQFNAASPDNNVNTFLACADSTTSRLFIYSDGDIDNHDNSYGATSDERIKQDIVDANSQWDDIKAIKVRNFKKKDDVEQYGDKAWLHIGVIAQELETVSPKLIKERQPTATDIKHSSEFGTLYKDGDTIPDDKKIGDVKEIKENVKRVNYSVLYMKAVKALQEAMTRIETLETKVKALVSK